MKSGSIIYGLDNIIKHKQSVKNNKITLVLQQCSIGKNTERKLVKILMENDIDNIVIKDWSTTHFDKNIKMVAITNVNLAEAILREIR